MGGCYSTESHRALSSPRHKQPKDKSKRNGHKELHYTLVSNGTTSQAAGAGDCLKKNCAVTYDDEVKVNGTHKEAGAVEEVRRGVAPSDSGIESISGEAVSSNVTTPDLGDNQPFKSFTLCPSCQRKLQRLSVGSCGKCGQVKVNASELSALVNSETYCTCGPRQLGKQSQCRTHGVRGKGNAAGPATQRHSDIPQTALLKSSLRKAGLNSKGDRCAGKHVRMSWKSADSLDMSTAAIIASTCMDRAKSEQSEVFGDDVSFRAPLAQFDSIDRHMDNGEEQCDGAILASRMSIYSELLDLADSICKCDFSLAETTNATSDPCGSAIPQDYSTNADSVAENCGDDVVLTLPDGCSLPPLDGSQLCVCGGEEDDEDSGHGLSKSEDRSASASDREVELEEEVEDLVEERRSRSLGSSPYRTAAASVLDNLRGEGDNVSDRDYLLPGPVSVVVRGRQMVVMDADTYLQMQNDLAMLREQLGHLTQIILEDDLDGSMAPLNLSLDN